MKKTSTKSFLQLFIFIYATTAYFVSQFIHIISPMALYRVIDTEKVVYPYMEWLTLFDTVAELLSFPLQLIPLQSGWNGVGQAIFMGFVWQVVIVITILTLSYKFFHRKKIVYFGLVLALILFNPVVADLLAQKVTIFAIQKTKDESQKYQKLKTVFENNKISFTLDSVRLIETKVSPIFKPNQVKIYEITLTVKDVPAEMSRFTVMFNEAEFNDYQIDRNYGSIAATSMITVLREGNNLNFYDMGKLNTEIPNQLKFVMAIHLKKQNPEKIRIRPRVDIQFQDTLRYTDINGRFSYGLSSPDLLKVDYPELLLEK